jgi:hypothetical protein
MTRMILALTMTIALLCLAQPVGAASQDDESATEAKSDSGDKGGKKDEPADEDDDDEDDDEDGPPRSAGKSESGVALTDLVHDGFVIRTTVFVPAEAVSRQTGKLSGDAIVVTLQKQFSTAVCYYALKAYVKEGLTAIPSCTVHR